MVVLDLEAYVQLQPADAGAVANQVVHKRNLRFFIFSRIISN